MPNFVSVAASVVELAHGEKLCTQSLNHSPITQLIWHPGNQSLHFRTVLQMDIGRIVLQMDIGWKVTQSQRIAYLTFYNTNMQLENYFKMLRKNGWKFSIIFWKNMKFSGHTTLLQTRKNRHQSTVWPAAMSSIAKSPMRMSPLTFHFCVSQFGWQLWFMKRE